MLLRAAAWLSASEAVGVKGTGCFGQILGEGWSCAFSGLLWGSLLAGPWHRGCSLLPQKQMRCCCILTMPLPASKFGACVGYAVSKGARGWTLPNLY